MSCHMYIYYFRIEYFVGSAKEYSKDRNNNYPENRVTMFFAGSMPPLKVILTPNFYCTWSPPQGRSSMRDKAGKISV